MVEGKISFSLGGLSFSAEGEEKWLSEQMDKIIAVAPTLGQIARLSGAVAANSNGSSVTADEEFSDSLATHLKAKGGESNQVKKFLATADWLRRRGNAALATSAVSKALSENSQKRLGNPADCLNKNTAKGFCEKKGDGFFITTEGLKSLGYQ